MIGHGRIGTAALLAGSGGSGGERRGSTAAVARACVAASALAVLAGCTTLDVTPPWAPVSAHMPPANSLTAQRVVNGGTAATPAPPLTPEPGDIWPVQEAPRATLADPEEALRNIPPYQPEGMRTQPPPPSADEQRPAPPPRRARGSSSPPPPAPQPGAELRVPAQPPALPVTPPPERADGRVIPYPGGNAVTTGGTDNYQTFNEPGTAGGGVAIPQGPTTTLIGPDGRIRVVPTPR